MSVFAAASYVDAEPLDTAEQSDWRTGLLLTRMVTNRRRTRWTVRWDNAQPGVLAELERHYAANRLIPFTFTPPGGTAKSVVYTDQPPQLTWANAATGSATVTVEECLATD